MALPDLFLSFVELLEILQGIVWPFSWEKAAFKLLNLTEDKTELFNTDDYWIDEKETIEVLIDYIKICYWIALLWHQCVDKTVFWNESIYE